MGVNIVFVVLGFALVVLVGLAALVGGIVCLFKKRLGAGVGLLIVFLVAVFGGGVSAALLIGRTLGTAIRTTVTRTMTRAAQDAERQEAVHREHIEKLKSYVPPEELKYIDEDFFTYPGFRDWWRFPLVYPYSIYCIDTFDDGTLSRCDGEAKIADGAGQAVLDGITHLNFDGAFLLARRGADVKQNGIRRRLYTYVLFEFNSGQRWVFDTEAGMLREEEKRGYTGPAELMTVEEGYHQCF